MRLLQFYYFIPNIFKHAGNILQNVKFLQFVYVQAFLKFQDWVVEGLAQKENILQRKIINDELTKKVLKLLHY